MAPFDIDGIEKQKCYELFIHSYQPTEERDETWKS